MRRRRGPVAGLVVVVAALALLLAPAGTPAARAAGTPFEAGSATASATVLKARVFYAGFTVQVPVGPAAASYEGRQSRALGGAVDGASAAGLIGVSPDAVSVTSIDSNGGDTTKTVDAGAGPVLGTATLTAKGVPAATSEVRLADVDLPGVLRIEGGRSLASSAVVDGTTRVARAEVTIASVTLAGGLVVLDGLRWESVRRTGAATEATGSFTLGELRIAGVPIATDLHALDPVLAGVNALLATTGLVLEAPQLVKRDNGAVDMGSLRIGLLRSPIGAKALGPIVAGVRPLLLPVLDALNGVDEDTFGSLGLLTDLGLGVADGSGGIELSIGGAVTLTDDAAFVDPLAGTGGAVTPAPPTTAPPVAVGLPEVPGPPAGSPPAVPPAPVTEAGRPIATSGPAECALAASPLRQGACRGTNAAGALAITAVAAVGMAGWEVTCRRRRTAAPTTPAVPG